MPAGALRVRGLMVEAPWGPVIRGLNLEMGPGERISLVGESGCGKTMAARALIGLLPAGWKRSGMAQLGATDLLDPEAKVPGKLIGWALQEPGSAFHPHYSVGHQIAEAGGHALELLEALQVPEPARVAFSYPHQLSGGLLQRAALAASLASRPRILIADEPTTALDPTVSAGVLEALYSLSQNQGLAVILISHDLEAAASFSQNCAVMYAGRIVEQGPSRRLMSQPRHPYTRALLDCRPKAGRPPQAMAGSPPPRGQKIFGCAFAPRCSYADEECLAKDPAWLDLGTGGGHCCIRPLGRPFF